MRRLLIAFIMLSGLAKTCLAQVRTDSKPDNRFGDTVIDFPNFPKNHWLFVGIAHLSMEGLLQGFWDDPTYKMGPRSYGRYDLARKYAFAASKLLFRAKDILKSMDAISIESPTNPGAADHSEVLSEEISQMTTQEFKIALDDLAKGIREFQPELDGLGPESKASVAILSQAKSLLAQVRMVKTGAALVQFPDVTTSHWAAKDVLEMRKLGLIHGYEGKGGKPTFN